MVESRDWSWINGNCWSNPANFEALLDAAGASSEDRQKMAKTVTRKKRAAAKKSFVLQLLGRYECYWSLALHTNGTNTHRNYGTRKLGPGLLNIKVALVLFLLLVLKQDREKMAAQA